MAVVNSVYTERYQSYIASSTGKIYKISIFDRKCTGMPGTMPYPFTISNNPVNITFDSEGQDKFNPIVGSKCTLDFMMTNDSTEYSNDFMRDLLGISGASYLPYEEGDIFITVSAMNGWFSYSVIFCGEYLMDLDTLPDTPVPFPIRLTFTDGIGKLRDIDFRRDIVSDDGDQYHLMGHQKFSWWLGEVLQHTKFYKNAANPDGFWNSAANKVAYQTTVRWWNHDFYYKPNSASKYADPLAQTKGQMTWTRTTTQQGDVTNYASAYEVLEAICKSWGMRLICWQGVYIFVQIFNYASTTNSGSWNGAIDNYTYRYYADGDAYQVKASIGNHKWGRFLSYVQNVSLPGDGIQKLTGGLYKFMPVLRKVKSTLQHSSLMNIWPTWDLVNGGGTLPGDFIYTGSTGDHNTAPIALSGSQQYKIRLEMYLGFNMPNTSAWNSGGWYPGQMTVRIMALNAPSGNLNTTWLATLNYMGNTGTYEWYDSGSPAGTNTWNGSPIGIVCEGTGGPYGIGQTVVPISPILEFPGYRNEPTYYAIHLVGQVIDATNTAGQQYYYTHGTHGFDFFEPTDNTQLSSPAWGPGLFNDSNSIMAPLGAAGTTNTANTQLANSDTDNSSVLDWKNLFWDDGPEYYSEAALQVRSGNTTWTFSDWTNKNWAQQDPYPYSASNPAEDSGKNFVELLMSEMKRCQQVILKRTTCSLIVSPQNAWNGSYPHYPNPMGIIEDCDINVDGSDIKTRYFFTRGSYNLTQEILEGDWIEATCGPEVAGTFARMGGPGSQGTGGGSNVRMSRSGRPSSVMPRITMMYVDGNVYKDQAITSLNITQVLEDTSYSAFQVKTGDKVFLKNSGGYSIELTLTSDLTAEGTSIEFSEVTPTVGSYYVEGADEDLDNTQWTIACNLLDIYEQSNRKTRGTIGGMEVTSTSIDGAASVGRTYLDFRADGDDCVSGIYYTYYGEDNNKSGRMNNLNELAPGSINAQKSLKGGRFYCDHDYAIERAKIIMSATSESTVTIELYKATPVDESSSNLSMSMIGTAVITGLGNGTTMISNFSDVGTLEAGDMLIPHVVTGIGELTNFRGHIVLTLIRK